MSPLEQYMRTCKSARVRGVAVGLPGKVRLRSDRQWMSVSEMARKYGVPHWAMSDILAEYGITDGMRYKYCGTIRRYQ